MRFSAVKVTDFVCNCGFVYVCVARFVRAKKLCGTSLASHTCTFRFLLAFYLSGDRQHIKNEFDYELYKFIANYKIYSVSNNQDRQ